MPFSYLPEASVLSPSFLEVCLTEEPTKLADSRTTVSVSGLISESSPPITPATATGPFASFIISMESSKLLSTPSRVVNFDPSSATSTTILPPAKLLISKACSGCPYSIITKFVMSTMLLIGLIPAAMSFF